MKRLLLFCYLLILHVSFVNAQSWIWGREGYGDLKAIGFGTEVATDKTGNAYLAGSFNPVMIFSSDTLTSPNDAGYLIKYNSAGNVIWSRQLVDTIAQSYSSSVATDISGNIYVTGYFYANARAGSVSLINPYWNSPSAFLIKYNSNGNVIWAKWSQTSMHNTYANATSVATDKWGNVFITGYYYGTMTFGSYNLTVPTTGGGGGNAFIVKYDSNGNVLWANQSNINKASGNSADGLAVATDKNGNAYVTGIFSDTVSFGTIELKSYQKTGSIFLVKYSASGNVLWAKQSVNGSANSSSSACSVIADVTGNPYITGYLQDTVSFGSYVVYSPQLYSMFLTKYDTNGNVIWAKLSSANWQGTGLASDASNHIYMAGISYGKPHVFTMGSYSLTPDLSASFASFIAKFDTSGQIMCGSIINNVGTTPSSFQLNGVASDVTGTYVYTASMFDTTVFCGPDTLLSHGSGGDVFLGRWQPCCSSTTTYSISGNTTVKAGDSTTLTVSPSGSSLSYVWSNGATSSSITVSPMLGTTYSVIIYDTTGCPATAAIGVDVECGSLFVPDAFSPNKDGKNDILYVRGECIDKMDFIVYNRWGNKVFESTNISNGWDGTYKGEPQNTATFAYYLSAILFDGTQVTRHGNVSLVR